MSYQPGLGALLPDQTRHLILHSIIKQASKARDGLDHRSITEIANALHLGSSWPEIRDTVLELVDLGYLAQGHSRTGGPGFGLGPQAVENLGTTPDLSSILGISEEPLGFSLTPPCVAGNLSHKREGTMVPGNYPIKGSEQVPAHKGWYPELSPGTRTVSEKAVSTLALRGDRITRKRAPNTDPDTPFGLVAYFKEQLAETGFWGVETNEKSLRWWFSQLKRAGASADEIRKLINLFFLNPEQIRSSGQPAWKVFLGMREALAKQAGVRSHRRAPNPFDQPPRRWSQEEMDAAAEAELAQAYYPADHKPPTQEEMDAEAEAQLAIAFGKRV